MRGGRVAQKRPGRAGGGGLGGSEVKAEAEPLVCVWGAGGVDVFT